MRVTNGPAVANPQGLRFIPSASCSVRRAQDPSPPPAGRYPSFVQDGDPRAYHLPDKSNSGQHRRSIAVRPGGKHGDSRYRMATHLARPARVSAGRMRFCDSGEAISGRVLWSAVLPELDLAHGRGQAGEFERRPSSLSRGTESSSLQRRESTNHRFLRAARLAAAPDLLNVSPMSLTVRPSGARSPGRRHIAAQTPQALRRPNRPR